MAQEISEWFECDCGTRIKFQFGARGPRDFPSGGCGQCAKKYRIAQVSMARRIRLKNQKWNKEESRPCKECGTSFIPAPGRGNQATVVRCPDCRQKISVGQIRCSDCDAWTQRGTRGRCSHCVYELRKKEAEAREERKLEAQRLKKEERDQARLARSLPCASCSVVFDPSSVRTERKDLCSTCYRLCKSRLRNRIRNFKDRLFTTLVYDDPSLDFIMELLDSPCLYCGSTEEITIEHKVPLIRGGTNELGNLAPACRPCNTKKGTQTDSEYEYASS